MRFNFSWYDLISTALRFFQQSRLIYRRLQAVVLTFFLIVVKCNIYTHTHEVPSDKSLFFHKASSLKPTSLSPPLFYHEDATDKYPFSNYSGNIYLQLWCVLFQLSICRFSQMQFGVIHLQIWGSTQPYFAFLTLAICYFLVFDGSHTATNSLTLHEPGSVVS